MKRRYVSLLSVALAAVTLLFSLSSCGGFGDGTATETTTASTTEGTGAGTLDVVKDGGSEFYIVRPEKPQTQLEIDIAVELRKAFEAATGSLLGIVDDWVAPTPEFSQLHEYEICVGDLTRNGEYYDVDPSALAADEFIVRVCGTRIVLVGNTPVATKNAVEWFISEYLTATDGSLKNVSVSADLDFTGKFEISQTIRIMTQNLLATDTEYIENMKNKSYAARCTADLTEHTLVKRQPRVLSLISDYRPASLGVQECSASWRTFFSARLSGIGYSIIGAGKNPKISIIYDTSIVRPLSSGSIWLTEKPELLKVSQQWKGTSERLAMYVVFEIIATGQKYIHFNTHIATPENDEIQTRQTEVLNDYIAEIRAKEGNIPAFVTGDFNYTKDNKAYKAIVGSVICDTKTEALVSTGNGSFNKFIGQDYASLPIDQVLATKDGVDFINEYRVIYDTVDGCFISDHYAVYADVTLEK